MSTKTPRIYIILQGGIGNQLFQYAAGLVIAQHDNTPVALSPIQENKHSTRDYRSTLYRRLPSVEILDAMRMFAKDAFQAWSPTDYPTNLPIALQGYFQYLPAIVPILPMLCADLLSHLQTRREDLRRKYRLVDLHTAGFIHVRRGDYLKVEPGVHWAQGAEYYVPALEHFPPTIQWYVLSDDTEWCKRQPMFSSCTTVEEPDELDGLAFMSLCHGGAIIANSTYSWWGAMLGGGAKVVYPSKWYKNEQPELFPTDWIRLHVGDPPAKGAACC